MIKNNNSESTGFNNNSSFPDFDEFVSSFGTNSGNTSENTETVENGDNPFSNIDMSTILKMKKIMDSMNSNNKNNPRANLLLSLKPYLRPERRPKVDQYIQLFNMGSIMENFKSMGGEK